MTYRHDSEVPLRYGAFVDKTTKKEIKNGFLKYYEKKHTTANLTTYNISELSERTKGSNFMYNSMFSGEEGRNCLFLALGDIFNLNHLATLLLRTFWAIGWGQSALGEGATQGFSQIAIFK